MHRVVFISVLAALLILALPLSALAANGSGGGNGKPGKITICHKPQGARPVTISISKAALKAHKAHGDTEGSCPASPTTAVKVCTFDAATSAYYAGSNASAPLYATGAVRFAWAAASGAVKVPGGYWNEVLVSAPATTYYNNVAAGSVTAGGAVNLSFVRTVPDSNSFSFSGSLSAMTGSSTVSGFMAGNWFTSMGTITCSGS